MATTKTWCGALQSKGFPFIECTNVPLGTTIVDTFAESPTPHAPNMLRLGGVPGVQGDFQCNPAPGTFDINPTDFVAFGFYIGIEDPDIDPVYDPFEFFRFERSTVADFSLRYDNDGAGGHKIELLDSTGGVADSFDNPFTNDTVHWCEGWYDPTGTNGLFKMLIDGVLVLLASSDFNGSTNTQARLRLLGVFIPDPIPAEAAPVVFFGPCYIANNSIGALDTYGVDSFDCYEFLMKQDDGIAGADENDVARGESGYVGEDLQSGKWRFTNDGNPSTFAQYNAGGQGSSQHFDGPAPYARPNDDYIAVKWGFAFEASGIGSYEARFGRHILDSINWDTSAAFALTGSTSFLEKYRQIGDSFVPDLPSEVEVSVANFKMNFGFSRTIQFQGGYFWVFGSRQNLFQGPYPDVQVAREKLVGRGVMRGTMRGFR